MMKMRKGDLFKFGRFKDKPIEWIVLSAQGNKAFLLSFDILEDRIFDSESNNYPDSEIRKYLNGEFLDNCFTEEEKSRILLTNVDNEKSARNHNDPEYADGYDTTGPNTQDMVFLLSFDDVTNRSYGFCRNDESDYGEDDWSHGGLTRFAYIGDGYEDSWWLRSPVVHIPQKTWYVHENGSVEYDGWDGNGRDVRRGVRPALWIDLNAFSENSEPLENYYQH